VTRWNGRSPPSSNAPKKTHQIPVANFLEQARRAEDAQREYYRRLVEDGWIYHPETGHYTHPSDPTVEIWPS
jgi:hypothetical protein